MQVEKMSRGELLEIISKLPRTADGVPIVPGMELWRVFYYDDEHLSEPTHVDPIAGFRVIGGQAVELLWPNGWGDVRWSGLYSTYDAAKAATADECKRNGNAYLDARGFARPDAGDKPGVKP